MPPADPLEAFIDHAALLARGRHVDDARAFADRVRESDPLRHHLAHAMIAAVLEDAPALDARARAAYALAPEHPLVAQAACLAHLAARRFAEAEHEARRAILIDDTPRARRGLANVLLLQGRELDAERALRDLVARRPDADAHLTLARLAARRGDTLASLAEHAAAWSLGPDRPDVLQSALDRFREASWPLGVIMLTRLTRASTSDDTLRALLDLTALHAHRHLGGLALMAAKEMRDDVVRELVATARSLGPELRVRVARALADAAAPAEARTLLDLPLPGDADPRLRAQHHAAWGAVHARTGDHAAALDAFARAVSADPGALDAAADAIHHALALGRPEALARAAEVLGLVPERARRLHAVLTFNEAAWLHATGRDGEARGLLDWLDAAPGQLAPAVRALRDKLVATDA